MHKRIAAALLGLCIAFPLAADQKPPVFYFGGKALFVGMPKSEAVAFLSACCELSPPADSENENVARESGRMVGHFISSKDETPRRMLGAVFFVGGKVARVTRPLDDAFDTGSDDVVAFARAVDRSLSEGTGNSSSTVAVSTQHERMANAEVEILSLSFPNGRGIELQIFTLDTPSKVTGKRDSVSLDEALEAPQK